MSEDRQIDLESLVAFALERVDEVGPSAIEAICARHPEHAAELRRKLALLGDFGLDRSPTTTLFANTSDLAARLGPYQLVKLLGKGGMGEVWLAEQSGAIERQVAIKFIRGGAMAHEIVRRFESERRSIARMEHDGIAKAFEVGLNHDVPYLVMEYVDGHSITKYCEDHGLDVRERVQIFLQVCDAVQHAHQKGVIHRDLKPSNILVAKQGNRHVAKVIDFGLAKSIEDLADANGVRTIAGQVVGTPEYMSPEQADPERDDVDVRSDVYSLGVVLYEMLVREHPIDLATARKGGLLQVLQAIREQEAKRASTRVRDAAARGPGRSAWQAIRGDLDCILMRALEHDRKRRYASVADFAADLRRYLEHEPVLARAPGLLYRASKFARRHPAATVGCIVALAGLSTILGLQIRNGQRSEVQLQRFRELGDVVTLRKLEEEAEGLLAIEAGRIHDLARMRTWMLRASELLERRGAKRELLAKLSHAGGTRIEATLTNEDIVLRDSIVELLQDLEALEAPGATVDRVRRAFAWSEGVVAATTTDVAATWREAIASIADVNLCPHYAGLRIDAQVGLIPLRRDPVTKLWEFRVWQPGGVAACLDSRGHVSNLDQADPVLVLVPGGDTFIGAQYDDPAGAYFDGAAVEFQTPPHRLHLAPFFVGKHEATQAQWLRLSGVNPALYHPTRLRELAAELAANETPYPAYAAADLAWPVDNVSRNQASRALRSYGLDLPTEAQWEYAARAGTTWPWWTGRDATSVVPTTGEAGANVADACAAATGAAQPDQCAAGRDGWPVAARVDALRANPFGLHHVLGNVWEWCRDSYRREYPESNYDGHRPGDGLLVGDPTKAVMRGGSWKSLPSTASASYRQSIAPDNQNELRGVRIVRALVVTAKQ